MDILNNIVIFLTSLYLSIVPAPEFREGVLGQPVSFYPMKNVSEIDKTISRFLFRGLFTYDIFGELAPDLVESWEISEDGKSYTFKIKENQKWVDGSKITSDDLFYTSINTPSLQGIEINKIDEYTIKYTLQNKYAPFLHTMTAGIIKNNSLENQKDLAPISSGDFRVISMKRQGPLTKELTLYSDKFQISKITFRFYNSKEELLLATKLQEIDAFLYDETIDVKNLPNMTNHPFPLISNSYGLFFNSIGENSVSKDDRIKISKSINLKDQFSLYGIPVEGVISRSSFTNKKLKFDKFDRNLSDTLALKKLTITVPEYKNNYEIASRIKNELEDNLKTDVEIKSYSAQNFVADIIQKKDFQAIFFGIQNSRDPDRYLNWHSSGIELGYNFTNFQNPISDQALEEGRSENDATKRRMHYNKFQEIFDQNQPAVFFFHPNTNYYVSNRVFGITQKYTFELSDRFSDFANWRIN